MSDRTSRVETKRKIGSYLLRRFVPPKPSVSDGLITHGDVIAGAGRRFVRILGTAVELGRRIQKRSGLTQRAHHISLLTLRARSQPRTKYPRIVLRIHLNVPLRTVKKINRFTPLPIRLLLFPELMAGFTNRKL